MRSVVSTLLSNWRRRILLLAVVPLLVYLASFVLLTFPLILHFRTHIFGDAGDTLMHLWGLWWVDHAIRELHQSPWWTAYLFAPDGVSLIAHNLILFNGLVGIPLMRFLTLIETSNLLVIFGFVASGLTAFWLAREVSGSYIGGLVGGFIFSFSNYHFAHAQGHHMLVAEEWVPLFALCWLRLSRSPSVPRGLAAAGALGLVLLCDFYGFLCCVLFGLFFTIYEAISRRDAWFAFRAPARRSTVAFVAGSLLSCGYLLLPLWIISRTHNLTGTHPTMEFSLDLLALFIPGGHWRFASLTEPYWSRLPGNIHESSVHVGLTSVAMAVYVWHQRILRRELLPWFVVMTAFAVLALGPVLHVWGQPIGGAWLPFGLLARVLPLVDLSGLPVRLVLIVPLCLAVIGATAVGKLIATRSGQRVTMVGLAVLLFELLPAPIPSTQLAPSPVYRELIARKEPGALVDVSTSVAEQMWLQTLHQRPMAFGYISRVPASLETRAAQIRTLAEQERWDDLYCYQGFRFAIHGTQNQSLLDLAEGRHCPELHAIAFEQGTGLGTGWSNMEKTMGGVPYRWSHARSADLRLAPGAPADRQLRFHCWPFTFAGAPTQTVELFLNGTPLGLLGLAPEERSYTVEAPAAVWHAGANQLQLRFRYAESPARRIPSSLDQRSLVVAFSQFEVEERGRRN